MTSDPSIEIANVVGSVAYQQEIDLQELAKTFNTLDSFSEVKYEPAENHWLQTRIGEDEVYVAFYRSGKVSIVGCRSVDHFHKLADEVNSIMKELLKYEYEPEVEVSNIVVTASIGDSIPLERLALHLGFENVEYEPEQFPALLYRVNNTAVLVFASGKLVISGLRDSKEATPLVQNLITDIKSVKR